jgi:hypothetical protein
MSSLRLLARIIAVEPLDGFRLRLTFTDELVREVDLSGNLCRGQHDRLAQRRRHRARDAARASAARRLLHTYPPPSDTE